MKTKPTQASVKELQGMGIQPDVLVCRSEHPLTDEIKGKIALFCNVPVSHVLQNLDVDIFMKHLLPWSVKTGRCGTGIFKTGESQTGSYRMDTDGQ